jgi:hypothetical protein
MGGEAASEVVVSHPICPCNILNQRAYAYSVSDFVIKRVLWLLTGTQAGCNQWVCAIIQP